MYENLKKVENSELTIKPSELQLNYHFVEGPFVEILSGPSSKYYISFINNETGVVYHSATISNGEWTKSYFQYYVDWKIEIRDEGRNLLKVINQDLKGKRVFIVLDSRSLGDTLAWMPYAEEFAEKHGCKVLLSTFMNSLFTETYPTIEFVEPGQGVTNIMAQYNIGWFYTNEGQINFFKNPLDPKENPMQQTATDILGLEFSEKKPRLLFPKVGERSNKVYIGFHSTAQAKYWNNPNGWREVCDYLKSIGFEPIILSQEPNGYCGNEFPPGVKQFPKSSLKEVINELSTAAAFIGVGSGLTWLAWACNIPTVLISGFSEPWTEMQPSQKVGRVSTPKDKRITSGCFNKYKLDPANWNWYEPSQFVGTPRQYECSKSITSEMVIKEFERVMA